MPIIDLHCDTIMALMMASRKGVCKNLYSNDLMLSIEKMNTSNYMAQCLAMFVPFTVNNPYELCKDMLKRAKEEVEEYSEYVKIAYNKNDIINTYNDKKIALVLTIEEGGVVQGSIEKLEEFYDLGVRMICLNWNYENGIGHPNYGLILPSGKPDFTVPNTINGLTDFGFKMIEKMNDLGMIIDVSHLSDKGFYDCISTSKYPIIASHSNARTCCNHVRNLTDDMIIKL
ncbi:MAG: membrane dipeptidase, partial [Acholeplasmatales bacterium]|nr:membrane dipeptidase [Acholeplasmatales bacterium]